MASSPLFKQSRWSWHPSLPAEQQRFIAAQLRPGEKHSELLNYEVAGGALKILQPPKNLGLIVRVSYDVDPNYLLILSSLNGHRILQRFGLPSVRDTSWKASWSLHDVGSFQRDHATGKLYFTRVANNTLFEHVDEQPARIMVTPFNPQWLWSWRVHDGDVFYSSNTAIGFILRQRTLSSGIDSKIRAMPHGDFALDLQRRIAVVPSSLAHEMDIGSIQLR